MNVIEELLIRNENMCETMDTDVLDDDMDQVTIDLQPCANTDTNNKHLSSNPTQYQCPHSR